MLAPGTWIDDRYEVRELLGRGGMADVLRADDAATGDPVAVKLLRDLDPNGVARFGAEISALRALDHPSVVRLRDAGAHDSQPYLVLDLVDGPTLAAVLLEGALGHEASIALGQHLAAGLAHAHAQDITHRDVKPSNILLDTDAQRPMLADFGLARLTDSTRITRSGVCVGTAAYLAPEQLEGQSSPASDIYALGLVLIECLTGTLCYPGPLAEAALARLHRSPVVPAWLPAWLQHTLQCMTNRQAIERPAAEAVATALQARSVDPLLDATRTWGAPVIPLAADLSLNIRGPAAEATATPHQRRRRRRPMRAGIAAATIAVAAGCAAMGLVAGRELRVGEPRAAAAVGTDRASPSVETPDPQRQPPASPATLRPGPAAASAADAAPPTQPAPSPAAAAPVAHHPEPAAGPPDPKGGKVPKPTKSPPNKHDGDSSK
jgi:hypothetical protein